MADSKLTAFTSDAGVAALRNQYGADLVALYVNDGSARRDSAVWQ